MIGVRSVINCSKENAETGAAQYEWAPDLNLYGQKERNRCRQLSLAFETHRGFRLGKYLAPRY